MYYKLNELLRVISTGDILEIKHKLITNNKMFYECKYVKDEKYVWVKPYVLGQGEKGVSLHDTEKLTKEYSHYDIKHVNDNKFVSVSKEHVEENHNVAKRNNQHKQHMPYLPLDCLEGAAKVMQFGASKYSIDNWRKGYSNLLSPLASTMNHLIKLQRAIIEEDKEGTKGWLYDSEIVDGEDKGSGMTHADHVITSMILLIHSMKLKGFKMDVLSNSVKTNLKIVEG